MAKIGKKEQKALNEKLFEVLSFPEASSEEVLELLNKGADPTSTVEAFEDGPAAPARSDCALRRDRRNSCPSRPHRHNAS